MSGISLRARRERLAGFLTVAAMLVAFLLANSQLDWLYRLVHHTPVSIRVGELGIDRPLIVWINKGLMVFFFFLIGLEIKREVLEGRLSDPKRVALPGLAAVGGMVAPAAIYLSFNAGTTEAAGWAIPTATDIVLALAALSLLRGRVPEVLVVFLTALAIFDDVGAILIIALFYSDGLSLPSLALAGVSVLTLGVLNRLRVVQSAPYVLVGVFLWAAVLKSGVHATLAGVVLALAVPLRVKAERAFVSPARRMEEQLHPWVLLGVVPVFAFFNAGISISELSEGGLWTPIAGGIALGLLLGKQLGIFGATWLAVRLGAGSLPAEVHWRHVWGISLLGGVGFTMSLFITSLAFDSPGTLVSARSAILAGSLASSVAGLLVLHYGAGRGPMR